MATIDISPEHGWASVWMDPNCAEPPDLARTPSRLIFLWPNSIRLAVMMMLNHFVPTHFKQY